MIVDAQLHEPSIWLDWSDADQETRYRVLTEVQLAHLKAVGVNAALICPVDPVWADGAATSHPDAFAVVRSVIPGGLAGGLDVEAPEIGELIEEEARKPTTVGVRIMPSFFPEPGGPGFAQLRSGVYENMLAACERVGLPVFAFTTGDFDAPAEIARSHPELTLIVDHLGLPQGPGFQRDSPPFRQLDGLLALAGFPNIAVKFSSVAELSDTEYPFSDVWPHLHRVVDAFGAERLLWCSDISRVNRRIGFDDFGSDADYPGMHDYAEALNAVRYTSELSAGEKELILGGTVQKLVGWPG